MNEIATVSQTEIPVIHSVRLDVCREFLTISVPGGWDEVRPLFDRALLFDGRHFTFSGWDSDTNKAFFFRPLAGGHHTATLV